MYVSQEINIGGVMALSAVSDLWSTGCGLGCQPGTAPHERWASYSQLCLCQQAV